MRKLRDAGQLKPEQMTCFNKPLPAEELYDLQSDPHELANVVDEPKYRDELKRMRAELDRWKAETKDMTPKERTADEFDRELGTPLPGRQGSRRPR